MKVKSAIAEGLDQFRVGLALGESLREVDPEILMIFSSIDFHPFDEFIEGIETAFEGRKIPLIVGGTGDGFYETDRVGEIGASAIAINFEGEMELFVSSSDHVGKKTQQAIETSLRSLKEKCPEPSFVFCLSDFQSDGSDLVNSFNELFNCPLIGGLLGHGRSILNSYGFVNRNIMKEALIFVGFQLRPGSNLIFDIKSGSGWTEIGHSAVVTKVQDKKILQINNRPATKYLEDATGKACWAIDKGVTGFKIQDGNSSYIRSISNIAESVDHEGLTLYAKIPENSGISVCIGEPTLVKDQVTKVCREIADRGLDPEFAIVISCAGRKWLLVEEIKDEVHNVFKAFNKKFPLVGFPSYGEMAPMAKGNSRVINGFHNVTYVILTVGYKK